MKMKETPVKTSVQRKKTIKDSENQQKTMEQQMKTKPNENEMNTIENKWKTQGSQREPIEDQRKTSEN